MFKMTTQYPASQLADRLGGSKDIRRSRRAIRPALESLEGRVVMTAGSLDPTFGANGTISGTIDTGNGPDLSDASAVAVEPNGDIIVVGLVARPHSSNSTALPTLAARRYLPNGTLDTTFGTGGQVDVPAPTGYEGAETPHNVVIEPNGDIVFATTYSIQITAPVEAFPGGDVPDESVVARLTSTGQLDSGFGTNGQAVTGTDSYLDAVAVEPDGKIVVAGSIGGPLSSGPAPEVVRLTTSGALDTSFNAAGKLPLPLSSSPAYAGVGSLVAVQVASNGQIDVAGVAGLGAPAGENAIVERINGNGTLDTSYARNGVASFFGSNTLQGFVNVADMALETGGSVVLVGDVRDQAFVLQVNPAGVRFDPASPISNPTSPPLNVTYTSVAVQPDGKIVVGGSTLDPNISSLPPSQNTSALVDRYLATGAFDPSFGVSGRVIESSPVSGVAGVLQANATSTSTPTANVLLPFRMPTFNSVAITPTGKIVAVGTITRTAYNPSSGASFIDSTQAVVSQFLANGLKKPTPGDYDGDGKSDIAAELTAFGAFAIRRSGGGGDLIEPFGPIGAGQAIPAPGDYDGDGKTDIAAYLPAYGVLVYRPSSGGPDVVTQFGLAGAGQSIPAPGDYDGLGKTDIAVYLPKLGILAYRPSNGGPDVLTQFGFAGQGGSIPAPGDYDGDGKTDIAVYLPKFGVLAYRPSSGGADVLTQFGFAGAGQTIPAPGDYDGDGKTDIAAYLPSLGIYAYRPSSGGADVLEQFGLSGSGGSIPAPGDYNGDGKTDIAVYLPSLALFAYRPSGGGPDVLEQFGAAGTGQTVPAGSIPYAQPSILTGLSVSSRSVAVNIPLTEEVLSPPTTTSTKKKARSGLA